MEKHDYKILHTINCGVELYEVFYNDYRMTWYDYQITSSSNPYQTLKEAKDMIESHKRVMRMIEESGKDNLREWLTEDGSPILARHPANEVTHSSQIGEACVLLMMVLVAVGIYLWVY